MKQFTLSLIVALVGGYGFSQEVRPLNGFLSWDCHTQSEILDTNNRIKELALVGNWKLMRFSIKENKKYVDNDLKFYLDDIEYLILEETGVYRIIIGDSIYSYLWNLSNTGDTLIHYRVNYSFPDCYLPKRELEIVKKTKHKLILSQSFNIIAESEEIPPRARILIRFILSKKKQTIPNTRAKTT